MITDTNNNLQNTLSKFWMFKNEKLLGTMMEYYKNNIITVDLSNLQEEIWDGELRIKFNPNTHAKMIMHLVADIVTYTRPNDMSMVDDNMIEFWWDC